MSNSHREMLVEKDKRFVWHPYTPMEQYIRDGKPLVIERAQGSRIYDVDGRSLIDGNSSWWTSLLGHNHPRLVAALGRQASQLCHVAFAEITHAPAVELAEALVTRAPAGLTRVFYSDNGSTAVEAALKQALQFWQQSGKPRKRRLLALAHAFHGETRGVMDLSGVDAFTQPYAEAGASLVASPADGLAQGIDALRSVLSSSSDEIAALVIEPLIQGAGGMRMYDPEYLRAARELTEAHDVLLIVDEVFTGYGRTGKFWACDYAGITPDILCSAKGLSGGVLPFAATLSSERVFDAFSGDPSRAFYYGHTYCGNPLGAAVALEVLNIYEDEQIVERSLSKATRLARTFAELGELPLVETTRARGMCAALELRTGSGYLSRSGWVVFEEALARGAYVRPLGNVVYLAPPLNIDDADLEELLAIVSESVHSASRRLSA